jgi:hypothetical protein
MKKIICLIDYSRASENAVQYATHLALDTSSKLILATFQKEKTREKIMVLAGDAEETAVHSTRLAEMCDQLQSVWKVRCDYWELLDLENGEHDLLSEDVKLIVMGIESSAHTTPHELFSRINFKLIRKSRVPVLLVPDDFQYHRISRLLYAFDCAHELDPPMKQLEWFADWTKSDMHFLSVLKSKYSQEAEDKIDRRNVMLQANWKSPRKLTFDYIYHSDITKCLDHYLDLWKSDDLIIFSISQPTLAERLFRKSVIKTMLLSCNYPVMIIQR